MDKTGNEVADRSSIAIVWRAIVVSGAQWKGLNDEKVFARLRFRADKCLPGLLLEGCGTAAERRAAIYGGGEIGAAGRVSEMGVRFVGIRDEL